MKISFAIFVSLSMIFLFACGSKPQHEVVYNADSTMSSEIFHLPGKVDSEIKYEYWNDGVKQTTRKCITIYKRRNDSAEYFYDRMYDSAGAEILIGFKNYRTGIDYMYQPKWTREGEEYLQISIGEALRYVVIKEDGKLGMVSCERKPYSFNMSRWDQHYDSFGQIEHIGSSVYNLKGNGSYTDTVIEFDTQEKKATFNDTLLKRINKIKQDIARSDSTN